MTASLPAPKVNYDPKALLNPKSAGQSGLRINPSSRKPEPTSRVTSDHPADVTEHISDQPVRGVSSMIEKIHNVASRGEQPQKKRKLNSTDVNDNDEGLNPQKTAFNKISNNGMLGDYLREKRSEADILDLQKPKGNANIVDLTTAAQDDVAEDDEVTIIGGPIEKEVCLGRIDNARVGAHMIPDPKSNGLMGIRNQWPAMSVRLARRPGMNSQIIGVIDPTGKDFGSVDVRTASALAPVMDSVKTTKVRVQARLPMRERKPYQHTGQLVSDSYQITINVYAPRSKVAAIGNYFSKRGVFFRQPLSVDRGVEVLNPHTPKDFAPKKSLAGMPTSRTGGSNSANYVTRTVEEVRHDVQGVFDTLKHSEDLPERDPPDTIRTRLLPHQKQALHFLLNREDPKTDFDDERALWKPQINGSGNRTYYNVITGHELDEKPSPVQGGILADVMGLGKTLNILALILATKEQASQHGNAAELQESGSPKAKGTLLLCPLSTIANWEQQIRTHVCAGALSYYIYHGPSRIREVSTLKEYDLVITPYGTVASEFDSRSQKNTLTPLQEIDWFRVVLDEAHQIREQSTRNSKAACALKAERRWAVTGTPIQNRLDDLGALIKFLRIKPFDERGGFTQFILAPFKLADPEIIPKLRILVDSITLRRLKDKISLPSRVERIVRLNFSATERPLYDWFARDSQNRMHALTANDKKALGGRNYAHVLRTIMRMRLLCAHGQELLSNDDLALTKGHSITNAIDLESEDEDRPPMNAKQAFDMFSIMREASADLCYRCNNRVGPREDVIQLDDSVSELSEDESTIHRDTTFGYLTPCNHLICRNCEAGFRRELKVGATPDNHNFCVICGTYIRVAMYELTEHDLASHEKAQAEVRSNPRLMRHQGRYDQPHTKTKALIRDLKEHEAWSEAHSDQLPIKSVVFSGWTSHLDLIQIALIDNHIDFVRLDGSMSRKARTQSLIQFTQSRTVRCILISISAGGLGLNLTAASRVYVMEPQFNPAAESQAIERVHRLGQKRDVEITKFIMNDSFEERILELQRKKQSLAELSLERTKQVDKAEAAKKRLEDLKQLFR